MTRYAEDGKRKRREDDNGGDEAQPKHKKHNGHTSKESTKKENVGPNAFADSKSSQGNTIKERPIQKEDTNLDPNTAVERITKKAKQVQELMRQLEDAMNDKGLEDALNIVEGDSNALKQCQEAKSTLQTLKHGLKAIKTPTPPNIPMSIGPFSVTRWESSLIPRTLPPLPQVLDPTLEASAFVHSSLGTGKATDLSYEQLEWIGDIYIELAATLLIAQTFPFLSPGKSSQMRERLVKNHTLAQFSTSYGFDKRAITSRGFNMPKANRAEQDKAQTKLLGDLFEAYVAAVILSDPANGVSRANQWLKDLWGRLIINEIIEEERRGHKFENPMWKLRGQEVPIEIVKKDDKTVPPKVRLQQLIGSTGCQFNYKDYAPERKEPGDKLIMFTVGAYLTGYGEQDVLLGVGQGYGKKDAGQRAAEMAIANTELMAIYGEKRKQQLAKEAADWDALGPVEQERITREREEGRAKAKELQAELKEKKRKEVQALG